MSDFSFTFVLSFRIFAGAIVTANIFRVVLIYVYVGNF